MSDRLVYHIGVYRGIKTNIWPFKHFNIVYHIGVYRGIKTTDILYPFIFIVYHIGVYRGIKTKVYETVSMRRSVSHRSL